MTELTSQRPRLKEGRLRDRKTRSHVLVKVSTVVFFFLFGAKLLNFLKKIMIGQIYGVSWVADAFFAASYLPYYGAIFFEGVLFLGFLPLFSQVMSEKGEGEARRFALEIFLFTLALTGLFVLASWWASPWIVRELVPGFTVKECELTRSLFQIMSLVLIFISLCSFFRVLNSYFSRYVVASSSGFVDTVVMITMTLLTWKFWGIYGAAWGAVAGAFIAMMSQAVFVHHRHPITLSGGKFPTAWFRQLIHFLIPLALIWAMGQIPFVILNRFGSGMWEGTISAMTIAYSLVLVPIGLVSHTVLIAVFPNLAKQASDPRHHDVGPTFFQTLRAALFVLIPLGFLLSGLASPLTVLLFRGGNISEEGILRIIRSLTCFGWSAFALYADLFMAQSLIAARRTFPAILLGASRAVLTYGLSYFLTDWWDYRGLALGFSFGFVLNFLFLFPLFLKGSPFTGRWKETFLHCSKIVLASSPTLGLGWLLNQWPVHEWIGFSSLLTLGIIALGALIGLGAFFGILALLHITEFHSVMENLRWEWNRRKVPVVDVSN